MFTIFFKNIILYPRLEIQIPVIPGILPEMWILIRNQMRREIAQWKNLKQEKRLDTISKLKRMVTPDLKIAILYLDQVHFLV